MSEVLTTYVGPESAPRRRLAVVGLAVAVVVTLAAGAFAAVSFAATDGGESPEAAVERLVEAVEQADVVGILESLTPGERASLRPGLEGVAGQLERLGVLEAGFELGPVSGLGAEVEGLDLSSTPLGEGVSAVTIEGGTITTTADIGALPLGPLLQVLLADADPPADAVAEDLAGGNDFVIVAVEEGGGWHVSLWYTLAESARRDSGRPAPEFGDGVEPAEAASPEAAVSEAVDAALRLDAGGVIALLDPEEARALQDYAPLFLPAAERAAQEAVADGYALEVDRLDTTVDRGDGTARVTVDGFAISGQLPDQGAVSVSYDGTCFTYESESDGSEEQCLDEMSEAGPGFAAGDARIELTAVERGGDWFLSPTRTLLDGAVARLAELEAGDLAQIGASIGGLLGHGLLGVGAGAGSESFAEVAPAEGVPDQETCVAPPVGEAAPPGPDAPPEGSWSAYGCVEAPPHPPATTAAAGG